MTVKDVVDILVNEKGIPEIVKDDEVYVLHFTEPTEDNTVSATRVSIHLFKTIEGVANFLFTELGYTTEDDIRNNFQDDGSEEAFVWDVIILKEVRYDTAIETNA